jgi:hypothetical protein
MHDCVLDYRPVEFPRILCDGATAVVRVLRYIELWQYHGYDDGEAGHL